MRGFWASLGNPPYPPSSDPVEARAVAGHPPSPARCTRKSGHTRPPHPLLSTTGALWGSVHHGNHDEYPPPTCRDRVAGQWRRPSSSTQSCSLFGAQSLAAPPPLPRLPLPRVGRSADPPPQGPGGGVSDVPTTITLAVAEMQGCFGAMPHLLRDVRGNIPPHVCPIRSTFRMPRGLTRRRKKPPMGFVQICVTRHMRAQPVEPRMPNLCGVPPFPASRSKATSNAQAPRIPPLHLRAVWDFFAPARDPPWHVARHCAVARPDARRRGTFGIPSVAYAVPHLSAQENVYNPCQGRPQAPPSPRGVPRAGRPRVMVWRELALCVSSEAPQPRGDMCM